MRPDESLEVDLVNTAKTAAREITPRQKMTAEQKEVARAVLYASLRTSRLPAMGFNFKILNFSPLEKFLKTYNTGKIDHSLLKAVQTTLNKTAVGTKIQHLSFENLRACYVHAWLLQRVYEETRAAGKRMDKTNYSRWSNLTSGLRKNMFLPQKSCLEVHELASLYLPVPPTKVDVRFVAPCPVFAHRPTFQLKLKP